MQHTTSHYIGRYAPSPTGPLHFGSVVTAVASYLDAKANNGSWLVRMEDLDLARVQTDAASSILRTLEQFGFEWDGPVIYQSKRYSAYAEALNQLRQTDLIYPCICSRKEIAHLAHAGSEGPVYPGTCRRGVNRIQATQSWRIKVSQ